MSDQISTHPDEVEAYEPGSSSAKGFEEGTPQGNSLQARMQARAKELQDQKTEIFDVPGFEGILSVEFRMLSFETSRKIGMDNERVRSPAMRDLYTMADQLVRATEGFYEEMPDGSRRRIQHDWVSLAYGGLDRPLPQNLTPRQALLAVVGDRRVPVLANQWEEWQLGERRGINDAVVSDFGTTP